MFPTLGGEGCGVQLEFVRVESNSFGGVLDLKVDIHLTLICPWFAGLEVEEGDGVVGRLDAVRVLAVTTLGFNVHSVLIWEDISVRSHLDQRA